MLDVTVYRLYTTEYNYCCRARGIDLPSGDYPFRAAPGTATEPWVKNFEWFIKMKLGLQHHKHDRNTFVKYDQFGNLVAWAVLYTDDVVYGGWDQELEDMRIGAQNYVTMSEVGKLDMHVGMGNLFHSNTYTIPVRQSIRRFMHSMYRKEAYHAKFTHRMYHEPLHYQSTRQEDENASSDNEATGNQQSAVVIDMDQNEYTADEV